jgi:hypothetical protein
MKKDFLFESFARGEKPIVESSLSRIIQHIENPDSTFGQISAFRGEFGREENENRHEQLKKDIRNKGLGFIEMSGGFQEEDGNVQELSLFVPNISKNDAISLGEKYGQFSILWKDPSQFVEIGTNKAAGIGQIKNTFKKSGKVIDLSSDSIKNFWSQIYRGRHRDKKFLFLMEKSDVNWWTRWKIFNQNEGNDSDLWMRIL